MAAKTESARTRIESIKTGLRATTSCTDTTVAALRDLLSRKNDEPVQKENAGVKVPGALRRKADAVKAAASKDAPKPEPTVLAPRDKYILATEVANQSLKTLADALKSQASTPTPRSSKPTATTASDSTRKAARPPTAAQKALTERSVPQTTNATRRSPISTRPSSSASSNSGPDPGLVATAECARAAFAYLGTPEAKKVVGKDSRDLQLENGVLALVGKLVALGLDSLAVKEIRLLKRRLDSYLGHAEAKETAGAVRRPGVQHDSAAEKESLATLLHFGAIDSASPALPLVANLQIYTLRIIARLRRPLLIEATWQHLQLANESSPANLLERLASTSTSTPKAARQLESLAQTMLALCPSISALDDGAPLQPPPETVFRIQHLAFTIRKKWWALANHKTNEEHELLEPFVRCLVAFARRSKLSLTEKYDLSKSLSSELLGKQLLAPGASASSALIAKTLCNLAQAAGLSDEALRWLSAPEASALSTSSAAKQACRLVRIATVSLEAANKGEDKPGLEESISTALKALQGSLGGTSTDLDSLFMEANALRRAATRSLAAGFSARSLSSEDLSIQARDILMIAASVHFSARFIGRRSTADPDSNPQQRHEERISMAWKCTKSIVESVITCCKRSTNSPDLWSELDIILQDCCYILRRLGEESESGVLVDAQAGDVVSSCLVKLSNAYWNTYLQLRKAAAIDPELLLVAMRRSIDLVSEGSETQQEAGHLAMKLERLGEALDNLQKASESRKAFGQCIGYHIYSNDQALADNLATHSLEASFEGEGTFSTLGRLLKALHRSYLVHGVKRASELAYHDDTYLQPDVRGAVLEWQLILFSKTLSKNRQWDSNLNHSIETLTEQLLAIYAPEHYPVRRLRVIALLLQLSQDHPHIVAHNMLPSDTLPESIATIDLSQDEGLSRFKEHLSALCSLKIAMQQVFPPVETLRQCFGTWEFLAKSASSWTALLDRMSDVDSWVHDIRACVDFLNAKGEEYLALPVLHLLVKVFELQNKPDASDLVSGLSALALQFSRLGYSGKAGLSLAKAEILVNRQTVSTESKLKWHMAYAEYLFYIGNTDKCASTLSTAESIARTDDLFMDMSKTSATGSQRLRYNSILADACYVYSLLAASKGSHKEAARYAKQCVTLNRRMWAVLESKVNSQKAALVESGVHMADSSDKSSVDPLASMRDDKGTPIISSNTHDALGGAEFWFMVPSLYRGLMQHSQVFANQGLLHEAIYVAEQAEKVAQATRSPSLVTDNASWRAACWAQSSRPDKAGPLLQALNQPSDRKSLSVAAYHSAVARVHHCTGNFDEEIASYGVLEQLLDELTKPAYIKSLGAIHPDLDSLASQIAGMSLDASNTKVTKAVAMTRAQKSAVKPVSRSTSRAGARSASGTRSRAGTVSAASAVSAPKSATKGRPKSMIAAPSCDIVSATDQCTTLRALQAEVLHRGVLANLLQDDLKAATALIERVQELPVGADRDVQHTWAKFKLMLAQSAQQIAADFAFNTLPESTIAFPAIGTKDRRMSEGVPMKKVGLTTTTKAKSGRAKKVVAKIDFADTLRQAREHLLEVHALSATHGSNHLFQQVSNALGHITVLLSAVTEARGSLHPLYAAYTSEIPKCNAMRLAQEFVESEKEQMSREECLQWPLLQASSFSLASASDFQQEYIDIIPEAWTAISLGLNEAHDELYVTRFEAGVAPFLLRLPLARHASRDLDEDEFTFEDGKRDFDEIIELSDFSTRNAKDMTSREARQQWWDEREALDTRLHELLVNMENIWLGGFKGIFSQHVRQPTLLAKFRKAFEDVLNRHLPSRSKKIQPKQAVLDTRVLELFVGLGDLANEELDLDEELMDLIYFVVDILQFNGEPNAYDEIDFDAMVIETQDALKAYHNATRSTPSSTPHTILMLDNDLHGFPWESLPCLEKLSVSRLPSLAALRERLFTLRPSTAEEAAPGHYIAASTGGTSILNPGGDLANTSKTLQPVLNSLQGEWTHIHSRAPTEIEFSTALGTQDLLLYFGHGSGAQFVRQKSVRRLYPGKQDHGTAMKPGCATAFLFGCSSVHLTENGIYEPSGMLQSYLTAGAPAVVGMLWDVTDKDCDRFAVRTGELWGLWPEVQEEAEAKLAKTPKKSGKGKAKARQIECERKGEYRRGVGLDEAVRDARQACYLKYLNGAAAVVYGIPCYLE
ncbi:Separase [Ascochyta rabiei]|uniref:separase n=1 Tax=Didymella rabiei TaxID=5454 RepID=A0A162XR19_DIDRA|nr:Separase [Ascochyta rabiei]KZM19656.1 peptidase [Ascochyta rabiei]UPX13858.1 Separase [Ascochyta rabiei]